MMSVFLLSFSCAFRFVHASSSPDETIFPFDIKRRDVIRERAPGFVGSALVLPSAFEKKTLGVKWRLLR